MNKITLIGNVGHTPEVKPVGDIKVARMSLGVTQRGYTKKDGSKTEDHTDWFYIEAWRNLAEIIEKYVSKGDKVYVEGKMMSRKYTGNDGVEKTIWEVKLENIELLTPKNQSHCIEQTSTTESVSKTSESEQQPFMPIDDLPF